MPGHGVEIVFWMCFNARRTMPDAFYAFEVSSERYLMKLHTRTKICIGGVPGLSGQTGFQVAGTGGAEA